VPTRAANPADLRSLDAPVGRSTDTRGTVASGTGGADTEAVGRSADGSRNDAEAIARGAAADGGGAGWITASTGMTFAIAVAVDPTTGSLVGVPPDTDPAPNAAPLNLVLPRYVPGSPYMLIAEEVFATDEGELWQQRTWFNPEDASSWDSTEDLGAAANLVRELLLVDESGALWRMRLWSDPAYNGSWVTQESLGAFGQDVASSRRGGY
jgi:hypothetical protein